MPSIGASGGGGGGGGGGLQLGDGPACLDAHHPGETSRRHLLPQPGRRSKARPAQPFRVRHVQVATWLAAKVVEAQGKGSVLATEVVEAQGKGGVSATKGVDAQDKGTAPSGRHNGRKRQRQWQHKATSVPFGAVHRQGCTVHRAFPAAGQSQPPSPRPESTPDTSRAGELRSRKAVGRRYGKALHWTADRQIGSARRHGGSGKHKAKALAKPSGSTPARPRPTTRRPTRTARGSAPAGHPAIATAVRGERRRETMQGGGRNRVRQRTKGREQQRAPQHYGEVEGQRK